MSAELESTPIQSPLQRLIEAASDLIKQHSAHVECTDPETHAHLVSLSKAGATRRIVIDADENRVLVNIALVPSRGDIIPAAEFRLDCVTKLTH